jgi:hypothetical protein
MRFAFVAVFAIRSDEPRAGPSRPLSARSSWFVSTSRRCVDGAG